MCGTAVSSVCISISVSGFMPARDEPEECLPWTRLWKAAAKEIAGSRCLPARRPVGGARTASGRDEEKRRFLVPSESDVWKRESSSADEICVVFGTELDCGKLWRRRSLGTGVYQPEDPWEVRERLLAETVRKRRLEAREHLSGRSYLPCPEMYVPRASKGGLG